MQWDSFQVRLIDPQTGQLLREHLRQKRGNQIKEEDRPPRTPLSTSQLLTRACHAGANIGTLCRAIHGRQGQVGVRRILGVLSLAKHASEDQPLNDLGDEAYGWGMDKADIVMRKGRFILWVHVNAHVDDDPDAQALSLDDRNAREKSERLRLGPEFAKLAAAALDSF